MKRPLDDTLITAFALGELPEPEQTAVAAEIHKSPELRAQVARIQQMATTLRESLAEEISPVPTALEKRSLLPANPSGEESLWSGLLRPLLEKKPFWKLSWAMGCAIAICAAAILSFNFWTQNKSAQNSDAPITVSAAPPVIARAPTGSISVLPVLSLNSDIISNHIAAKATPPPAIEVAPPLPTTNEITHMAKVTPLPVETRPPTHAATQSLSNDTIRDVEPYVALQLKLPNPTLKGTPEDLPSGPHIEPLPEKSRPLFMAPKNVRNVALNKPVTASVEPITGKVEQITDGDKEAFDDQVVEMRKGLQYVQIDLQDSFKIHAIVLWNDHRYIQAYSRVILQIADDPGFQQNVRTLFNNDFENRAGFGIGTDRLYFETREGRLIDAKGQVARYIRWYTQGSNQSALNNRTEIEVYGLPY